LTSTEPETTFKKSRASLIWVAVVLLILITLFIQTSFNKQPGYNVVVLTPAGTIDSVVLVDGKARTRTKSAKELGNKGGIAWLTLKDGNYLLELKNGENILASKNIMVKGKALVNIESEAQSEAQDKSPDTK